MGFISGLAACFGDRRDPRFTEFSVEELVGQRIYGLALGYEDGNAHEELRADPLMAVLVGKEDPLGRDRRAEADRGKACAGKSTLNRLELSSVTQDKYRKTPVDEAAVEAFLVEQFIRVRGGKPKELVLDLDATDDPLHGEQEGRFYHGYYRCYCYLPLYVFCEGYVLGAKLRVSNLDGSEGAVQEMERIVGQLRAKWPKLRITLRADSSFAREALMKWCEEHRVDYVFGLARNRRLEGALESELEQAQALQQANGSSARVYQDFRYQTRKSWSQERRVVGKAEYTGKGSNPRFVVTSLGAKRWPAQKLYEELYCARGEAENRMQGAAARAVCRSDLDAPHEEQSAAPVVFLGGLQSAAHAQVRRFEGDPVGEGAMPDDSPQTVEDRRPDSGQCPTGELVAERGLSLPNTLRPSLGPASTARLSGGKPEIPTICN